MDHVRRSTRPRVMKKKSDVLYFDDQKIELNEDERDLLYPNERVSEKRYCFCKRTEEETVGLTMIECDSCHDWFHDMCIGISPEEMQQMEIYCCPSCTSKPTKCIKRSQPSNADIELLLTALAELDEEKPRLKKKESKLCAPRIALYHFYESTDINKCAGIVGYIKNESSSTVEENKMIVPITSKDLERGVLWTSWGNYKVAATSDGRLQASAYNQCREMARNMEEKIESVGASAGVRVNFEQGVTQILVGEVEPLEIQTRDLTFQFCREKAERLANVMKCSSLEKMKENFKLNFKLKTVGIVKVPISG